MSLKPKRVNFEEKWQDLKETLKEVITLGLVKRDVWNDRFGYVLCLEFNIIDFRSLTIDFL